MDDKIDFFLAIRERIQHLNERAAEQGYVDETYLKWKLGIIDQLLTYIEEEKNHASN